MCGLHRRQMRAYLGRGARAALAADTERGERGVVKRDERDGFFLNSQERWLRERMRSLNLSKTLTHLYTCNIGKRLLGPL
jgi:hypothetical protein